ncbi:MAG: hypothetical protein E7380_02130 [Clostridiales bacterium]|nr:hypothetical protein [Clostridiales bacterium]
MNKNIQLSFWNYVKTGMLGKTAVKDWKELGMTIAMSFDFDVELHSKKEMIEVLDECAKEGLKLIIRDKRTEFRTYAEKPAEEFIKGVREAYADFGRHEATFGFFVGDEPAPHEEEAFIKTLKIVGEEMPELTPFGNSFPYWGGSHFLMLTGQKTERYDKLVDRMLVEGNAKLLGFDCYSQCIEPQFNQQTGIDTWFRNLDKWYEHCKEHDAVCWASALCVGHWAHRVPTEDDIRWQLYTALAHGMRGVVWFHLYQYMLEESYRNAPFYGKNFKRTETFNYLARQQDIFHQYYEEQFNKMELTDVYHTGQIYDLKKSFCTDETIREVNGRFSYPTIISYYKEFDSEERWVSIVNAHQRNSNEITVHFACGKDRTFWLAPGEIKLYKISEIEKE